MSLVGTRPILPDELEQYELHHRARIAIKPGITGMWQVSGRSDITDFEEIVRLDTEYMGLLEKIQEISPDIVIIMYGTVDEMSVKDGKDYLYLIWKCSSNRRQYIVGQLSKNGQYEFCYCEEFNEAVKEGFSPLISFEDTNRVYKSQELFPAFSSRLPDRKRKDINKILKRYGLEQYDSYELLKRGGAKLPIDNLQFIDPILNFSQEFKKSFYLAGVRHYLGCNGDNCCEAVKIVPGEEIKFVWEADNLYDKNAVQVYDQREKLIGYVPRYYAEAFAAFIKEKRVKKGKILCVDKNRNCDECIKIEVSVAGV